ncbi:alpha/beta fold hydrolase [Microbacterium sp. NPDC006705]|uniref:alpha/beta fold hydrolase n=1 Tax=unclassified Microbacterium TaxID=2609290 RepID=UPI00249E7B1C|nr:alpha/beta hydrolase [Microbacterium sp. BDGP8]WHE36505.1 alpha/beta hydrolase [Microbacterium sp. BDGP8]
MRAQSRQVQTSDGVTLEVYDTGGNGAPVLMLHGWSQSQEMFRHQRDGLGERRVITYDMRGHGRSEKPGRGHRIARLAADVRDILEDLDIRDVHLLGWSMGVSVIWSYLELFGDRRVRSLVLVDQPAAVAAQLWMSAIEQQSAGCILPADGLGTLANAIADDTGGDATVRAFVRSMFTGPVDDGLWSFVSSEVAQTPRRVAAPLLFDHGAQDWRELLPTIAKPTLVLGCDGSHVSAESQRYVASRIPGALVHIFPRDVASSHFPFLENPEAFNEVVRVFLDANAVSDIRPVR